MIDNIYKYPRLYLNAAFEKSAIISLLPEHAHYLRNVLRKKKGDYLRVFNGTDGEWLARIEEIGKKSCDIALDRCLRGQGSKKPSLHLYFSPIKKQRMDFLIEKSVELGVTDLHPVLMERSVMRKINQERIEAQIIEAAEQCERLDIPKLHDLKNLSQSLAEHSFNIPLYACLERESGANLISSYAMSDDVAFIIGPEGGFSDNEKESLTANNNVIPVGLGKEILRSETAAIACLSYAMLSKYV